MRIWYMLSHVRCGKRSLSTTKMGKKLRLSAHNGRGVLKLSVRTRKGTCKLGLSVCKQRDILRLGTLSVR